MKESDWITLAGVVVSGHRVASGLATDSPYPRGTIEMQAPFFRDRGLDLSAFFLGTLNVSIHPYRFAVKTAPYCFRDVKWSPEHPAEDFSFLHSQVDVQDTTYSGWLYYPHPETKLGHFQAPSTLELLMPPIPDLRYGDRLSVRLWLNEIQITPLTPNLT